MNYVAFLRGINVGGHHRVPMVDLREELGKVGCENPVTILNSGNIIFDTKEDDLKAMERSIEGHIQKCFGFPIPTIVRRSSTLIDLYRSEPFRDIQLTNDTRLYISFLKNEMDHDLPLPWTSDDNSYTILQKSNGNILSILDMGITKTPKAMEALEGFFGKEITTRNWKTIARIEKKIAASFSR